MKVTVDLDWDQMEKFIVGTLTKLEDDMIDASIKIADGKCVWIFSNDPDEEKKQIRKMLKAVKRVKSWYTA
jgi:hypothetical protein